MKGGLQLAWVTLMNNEKNPTNSSTQIRRGGGGHPMDLFAMNYLALKKEGSSAITVAAFKTKFVIGN